MTLTFNGSKVFSVAPVSDNFLTNGSFEAGITGWEDPAWANPRAQVVSSQFYSGSKSMRLWSDGVINDYVRKSQWVNAQGSTTYTLSAWGKKTGNAPASVRVDEYNNSGSVNVWKVTHKLVFDTNTWSQKSVTFTTNSETNRIPVTIQLGNDDTPDSPEPATDFYVDDINLVFGVDGGCSWSSGGSPSDFLLPGSGSIQAQSGFIFGNGTKLKQAIWRGDQGFSIIVPVINGEPNWTSAGPWSAPIDISIFPGSGSIQAQSGFIFGNGTKLMQSFWRGDKGYWRIVPIANGEPNWTSAGPWSAPIDISILPGSGSIQAQSGFIFGNGTKLMQSFWRGDKGYWQIVPIVNGEADWTCSPVISPTIQPTISPIPTAPASCTCLSNNTCYSSCVFDKFPEATIDGKNTTDYADPIKCTQDPNALASVPTTIEKNGWCTSTLRTKGDVNHDNKIDFTDYLYYVQVANGGKMPASYNVDADGDGTIGTFDRAIIMRSLSAI